MPYLKSNLGRNTRKAKSVRRVISAHQTEEERASGNEQNRQRMLKYVLRKQQSNMQLDLRMHVCEYGSPVLQHQMCSVLNKENTIGSKWLKDVNKEKHISHTIALHFDTTQVRIIV
ncbi:hypothetical protein NPIL_531011 [Nephila pilipes]|uniref:Uncharacterized protein n=1 Tax=Nephila pilipes TaxID=299642 RepID=A0A8X6NIY2_NEPPI|nr:hypothetical protein NPIL_531011 [Nephila pilipes]